MNRLLIHFPKWAYIVLPLFVSIFASGLVAEVQRRTDDYRTTQVDLARIGGAVYRLHSLEEEAVAEKHLTSVMEHEKQQIDHDLDNALLTIQHIHGSSVLLIQIDKTFNAYDDALDVEFPYLRTGNVEAGEKAAERYVDPAYDSLLAAIKKANAYYSRQAQAKAQQAIGSTAAMLMLSALCLGVFMSRVAKSQHDETLQEARTGEEERTRAVLETALDGVVAMDANGAIIGWNAQAEAIFGWTRDEALGRSMAEIALPDAIRDEFSCGFQRYLTGGEWSLLGHRAEMEAQHRDGSVFPVAISLASVRTDDRLTFSAFISDISERKEAAARLQRSEARYRSVVDHVKEVIFTTDAAGHWTFLNPAWTAITGYGVEESIGRSFLYTVYEEDGAHILTLLEAMLRGEKTYLASEMRYKSRSGELRWVEARVQSTVDDAQVLTGLFGTLSDITDRKSAEARLEHQALHDALTGLPNRLLFQDRLRGALVRQSRLQTGVAVLFVDLDNFKLVNDSMGHEAGDELLKAIADKLRASARRGDTIARLGGDEFTLLLDNVGDVEDAIQTAERILAHLKQPIKVAGREVFASASIGVVFSTDDTKQDEDLLRDADTAMYQAKSKGKSAFVVFDVSMNADAVERLELETGLRFALDRQELRVHYQPLIDLATGCMTGVEALVRWEHPTYGLMAPGRFIPVAEDTGMIVPIGYWVMEEACLQLKAWKEAYPSYGELTVSVNVSGKQLQRADVTDRVRAVMEKTHIAPGDLKLEITESVMMADLQDTIAKLHSLKALGVKLAMDDFGTGYSSMASLNLFPLDTVKIDRAFIKRLTEHHEGGSMVAAIIMLSKSLHLDVTGEGVETVEQLAQLQALGCQVGQGFYFAKPLAPDALADGIKAGSHHFSSMPDMPKFDQFLRAA